MTKAALKARTWRAAARLIPGARRLRRAAHVLRHGNVPALPAPKPQSKPKAVATPVKAVAGPPAWLPDPESLADEPFDRSLVAAARRLSPEAQVDLVASLLRSPLTASLGHVVQGLAAVRRGLHPTAFELFASVPDAVRLIPSEYAEVGLQIAPDQTAAELVAWACSTRGPDPVDVTDVVEHLLAHARHDDARTVWATLSELALLHPSDDVLAGRLLWLRQWFEDQPVPDDAPGVVTFGVIDYKAPQYSSASNNMGDYIQTLAALGHVLRHHGVEIVDGPDQALGEVARSLQTRIANHYRREGVTGRVRLLAVNRDASLLDTLPEPTWMLAFGWFAWRIHQAAHQFPFHPNVRPVFVSFHVEQVDLLTDEAVEYLKRYAPIGCRDWATVHLLLGAGIPAFFSGCITTTVGGYWDRSVEPAPTGAVGYVDTPARNGAPFRAQGGPVFRARPIAWNVENAWRTLEEYRVTFDRLVTSRLHCYLPMSSIGVPTQFTHESRSDPRFEGLRHLDIPAVREMGTSIADLLEPVLSLIVSGADEQTVYEAWAASTADRVEEARTVFEAPIVAPVPPFDVAAAVERVTTGLVPLSGEERVDVAIALDQGFFHAAEVSLGSMVANTSSPLRLHALARGVAANARAGLADVYPEIEFRWYDLDSVDFGLVAGLPAHVTAATMGRLLLPLLASEVARMVYLEPDSIVFGDLAELAAIGLGDSLVAARPLTGQAPGNGLRALYAAGRRAGAEFGHYDAWIRRINRDTGRFTGFDTSVLVLDLAGIRASSFAEDHLGYIRQLGLSDREVLNLWAGSRYAPLPREWNTLADEYVASTPKLLHFAGPRKPWTHDLGPVADPWRHWVDELEHRKGALRALDSR